MCISEIVFQRNSELKRKKMLRLSCMSFCISVLQAFNYEEVMNPNLVIPGSFLQKLTKINVYSLID